LLSGIGPHWDREPLGIATVLDLPGVGRNLLDHVLVKGFGFEVKYPLPAPNNNLSAQRVFLDEPACADQAGRDVPASATAVGIKRDRS